MLMEIIGKKGTNSYTFFIRYKKCPNDDFEWYYGRFCNVVDSISVFMDIAVGSNHAPAAEDPEEGAANCLHDRQCLSRIFVRDTLRAGTGAAIRDGIPRNDRVDHRGTAVGLCARSQQFFLWAAHCPDHFTASDARTKHNAIVRFLFILF